MNAKSARQSTTPEWKKLEQEIERVTKWKTFSVSGHLWIICHFGSYLASRQFGTAQLESSRREFIGLVKFFLDEAFEGRPAADVLKQLKDTRAEIESRRPGNELKAIAAVIEKVAKRIARKSATKRPVTADMLSPAFSEIDKQVNDEKIARWARRSWRFFEQLRSSVVNGTHKESTVDTAKDALVFTRYVAGWLRDCGDDIGDSENNLVLEIVETLTDTEFTVNELSQIHDLFCKRVWDLPSFSTKDAAAIIGVTVDRVHLMTSRNEVDSFHIRTLIPREEVERHKKGKTPIPEPQARFESTPSTKKILSFLKDTNLGIRNLLAVQDALTPRLQEISLPLKQAIQRSGLSEATVHRLINTQKIISFGLSRLIPESEALRLQRDPQRKHVGRPRISE